ncbi:hypothetical protein NHX12_001146 [Muraenolepis orangiensis]|uniref:Uncharacterized protein n=1 Tax=Muraenolepis orangiensis TaxID=630683 RepID=A0A9Q0IH01_9TELE|nr:hypothetical protein NHX12_001146 [Muraenolepis orangiensis]
MSVSMAKSGGVTVLTLNSDTGSACPPLCQILKALCYSPVCCSVSQKLRSIMGTSHSALGTLEVMVGLMNLGLGAILSGNWSRMDTGFPYWLGTLFILFGILCILSEKFPSPCLMVVGGVNVVLIILSVLQLCVSISCVVLGIRAVRKSFKKENQVQLGGGGGGEPDATSYSERGTGKGLTEEVGWSSAARNLLPRAIKYNKLQLMADLEMKDRPRNQDGAIQVR